MLDTRTITGSAPRSAVRTVACAVPGGVASALQQQLLAHPKMVICLPFQRLVSRRGYRVCEFGRRVDDRRTKVSLPITRRTHQCPGGGSVKRHISAVRGHHLASPFISDFIHRSVSAGSRGGLPFALYPVSDDRRAGRSKSRFSGSDQYCSGYGRDLSDFVPVERQAERIRSDKCIGYDGNHVHVPQCRMGLPRLVRAGVWAGLGGNGEKANRTIKYSTVQYSDRLRLIEESSEPITDTYLQMPVDGAVTDKILSNQWFLLRQSHLGQRCDGPGLQRSIR